MTAREIFNSLPAARPRHIYYPEDLPELKRARRVELEKLRINCRMALADGIATEPASDYRRDFEYARRKLDRDLAACALIYLFDGDRAAGEYVKKQVLELCNWRCAVLPPYDEVALSLCRVLPVAFDWTSGLYTDEEKQLVVSALERHSSDIEKRIALEDFAHNPGNSHTARLPAYLGEAALAMHGLACDHSALERRLDYAVDFYDRVFPYYGDDDGGWAEGPFYGSSYTKWQLPFCFAVKRICGHSFFDKPFYRNLSEFFVHFAPPGQEIHPFGDGHWPTAEEWPGFQAQDPFSVYANSPLSRRFSRELRNRADHFELHLLDLMLPSAGLPVRSSANSFLARQTGFVSMRRCAGNPREDVALLARASSCGSPSHQHADQGNFAILARGLALLAPSGYFGYQFGTEHHAKWTTQTVAQNCALLDGKGQIKGDPDDVGAILEFDDDGECCRAVLDLGRAYNAHYLRKLSFNRQTLAIEITDEIETERPVAVDWLLHSYVEPVIASGGFLIERPGATLTGAVLPEAKSAVSDRFAVPCPGLPKQYHLSWHFPARQKHLVKAFFQVELR